MYEAKYGNQIIKTKKTDSGLNDAQNMIKLIKRELGEAKTMLRAVTGYLMT